MDAAMDACLRDGRTGRRNSKQHLSLRGALLHSVAAADAVISPSMVRSSEPGSTRRRCAGRRVLQELNLADGSSVDGRC
jgi:hypothetical protein